MSAFSPEWGGLEGVRREWVRSRAGLGLHDTRCGVSAKQLERELGVTYKTAWRMFNKIRNHLMDETEAEPLSGDVEVDETFVGGKPRESYRREVARKGWNMQTAHWDRKAVVFGAVERGGRIRASVIPNSRGTTLHAKIGEYVLPDSMIYTDDFKAYRQLGKKGYQHKRINHSARIYVDGDNSRTTPMKESDDSEERAKSSDEPKQTTPEGLEIPVPKRREVIDALRKLVQSGRKP